MNAKDLQSILDKAVDSRKNSSEEDTSKEDTSKEDTSKEDTSKESSETPVRLRWNLKFRVPGKNQEPKHKKKNCGPAPKDAIEKDKTSGLWLDARGRRWMIKGHIIDGIKIKKSHWSETINPHVLHLLRSRCYVVTVPAHTKKLGIRLKEDTSTGNHLDWFNGKKSGRKHGHIHRVLEVSNFMKKEYSMCPNDVVLTYNQKVAHTELRARTIMRDWRDLLHTGSEREKGGKEEHSLQELQAPPWIIILARNTRTTEEELSDGKESGEDYDDGSVLSGDDIKQLQQYFQSTDASTWFSLGVAADQRCPVSASAASSSSIPVSSSISFSSSSASASSSSSSFPSPLSDRGSGKSGNDERKRKRVQLTTVPLPATASKANTVMGDSIDDSSSNGRDVVPYEEGSGDEAPQSKRAKVDREEVDGEEAPDHDIIIISDDDDDDDDDDDEDDHDDHDDHDDDDGDDDDVDVDKNSLSEDEQDVFPSQSSTPSVIEHIIQIQHKYFQLIASNNKTREGRLASEKYISINVGDVLKFVSFDGQVEDRRNSNVNESMSCGAIKHVMCRTVKEIQYFSSFDAMLSNGRLDHFLPGCLSVAEGAAIYRQFPRYAELESQLGAVSFTLEGNIV